MGAVAGVLVLAAAAAGAFVLLKGDGSKELPAGFTVPLDVCGLLTDQEAAALLGTRQVPKKTPSSDEVGPKCGWSIPNSGIGVQLQKDSDTPDPWSMTSASAHKLLLNQERFWNRSGNVRWSWEEIGAKGPFDAKRLPLRKVSGTGEEGFAFELSGPGGRVHTTYLMYRVANLVVQIEYTTPAQRPTDEQIKQGGQKAAAAVIEGLRRAG